MCNLKNKFYTLAPRESIFTHLNCDWATPFHINVSKWIFYRELASSSFSMSLPDKNLVRQRFIRVCA